MATQQHIFVGVIPPAAAPPAVGHHYVDTAAGKHYLSVGTASSADWFEVGSGGGGVTFPLLAPTNAQAYGFTGGDNDTYMGSTGDGNISFYANGSVRFDVNQTILNTFVDLNVGGDLDVSGNISAANFPPTGNTNSFAGYDGSGDLYSIPGFAIDTTSGGMNVFRTQQPNGAGGGNEHTISTDFDPLQNSPAAGWNIILNQVNFDVNSSGFSQGTGGTAAIMYNLGFSHQGTGNIGYLEFQRMSVSLGNGTDAISTTGVDASFIIGNIANNVTVSGGQIRGYGFSISAASGAIINTQMLGFYDQANIACAVDGYTSANFSPTVATINNSHNFNSLNINPNITTFSGNAGYFGVSISPSLGTLSTGFVSMFNANPNITSMRHGTMISVSPSVTSATGNVIGLDVDMSNITLYAGVASSIVIQDLTLTFNNPGDNNNIDIEYVNDGTAGAETANFSEPNIVVHIQSGVSTATQIKAALDANIIIFANITTTISGVGANPQVTQGPTNFAGGIEPGTKSAARFIGDVDITGALSFSGALSIGQLTSFAPVTMTSGGGVVSIDTLITQLTVPASATITGTDILGVNTAALINIGAGASVTTSFLGVAALGLPAVLTMGAGSTIDTVSGALFALSLGGGTGTVDSAHLCRALAINDGTSIVNKLFGFSMDMPAGSVGTQAWGVYIAPDIPNWMQGSLVLGGAALGVPANSDIAFQIRSKKSLVLGSLTTLEIAGITAFEGAMVYDSDLKKFQGYDGTSWVNLN